MMMNAMDSLTPSSETTPSCLYCYDLLSECTHFTPMEIVDMHLENTYMICKICRKGGITIPCNSCGLSVHPYCASQCINHGHSDITWIRKGWHCHDKVGVLTTVFDSMRLYKSMGHPNRPQVDMKPTGVSSRANSTNPPVFIKRRRRKPRKTKQRALTHSSKDCLPTATSLVFPSLDSFYTF